VAGFGAGRHGGVGQPDQGNAEKSEVGADQRDFIVEFNVGVGSKELPAGAFWIADGYPSFANDIVICAEAFGFFGLKIEGIVGDKDGGIRPANNSYCAADVVEDAVAGADVVVRFAGFEVLIFVVEYDMATGDGFIGFLVVLDVVGLQPELEPAYSVLRGRLARARLVLSRQLVSSYEGDKPDLVRVVLDANGFTDLLEKIDFLHRAEQQQQSIITLTRVAKSQADTAALRLAKLQAKDRRITQATAVQAAALAGMNALLQSKQAAVGQARAAQQTALAAARARGAQLQGAISRLQAQAAAQAAAQVAAAQRAAAHFTPPAALGPSGGWAIPYAIVLCESGGQNLPPNSAGASGYYQIIPSTWSGFGGTGPAAYLAGKAEQDAVASRIWNGGAGASNWVCAGIVGIH